MATETTGLQLRSLIKASGELELSLATVPVPAPGVDEVLVRIEAAPINPSDLGLLVGAADMSTARSSGSGNSIVVFITATSFIASRFRERLYVVIGVVAGTFSIVIGAIFLFGLESKLPSLEAWLFRGGS